MSVAIPRMRRFMERTIRQTRKEGHRLMRLEIPDHRRLAIPLMDLQAPDDLRDIAVSSDCHYGGVSNVTVEMVKDEEEGKGVVRFHGRLRDALTPLAKRLGLERSGYAGFRTIQRRSLWGKMEQDLSDHSHIRVRVRNNLMAADPMNFYVNLQTDSYSPTDIYQHPLRFNRFQVWEDVFLPLSNFTWIVLGKPAQNQRSPSSDMMTTIGISVIAPPCGPFDLSISHVDLVNLPAAERSIEPPTSATQASWEGDQKRNGELYKIVATPSEESWQGLDDETMFELRLQENERIRGSKFPKSNPGKANA